MGSALGSWLPVGLRLRCQLGRVQRRGVGRPPPTALPLLEEAGEGVAASRVLASVASGVAGSFLGAEPTRTPPVTPSLSVWYLHSGQCLNHASWSRF